MPNTTPSLLNYLHVVAGAWRDDPRDDAELLTHFADDGDEAAFRALVWRHGPLVWQTCRRILGDTPDAEDIFQATFLVLVRKAGQFPVASLAGWLHRVARRAALNADAAARRHRGLEQRLQAGTQPAAEEEASRAELCAVVDEELADLPERLRVPLVLRYLEGKTLAEVARILGCSLTPLTKRLARGEAILRQQLERRGLTVGVVSIGALLASTVAASAVPAGLIRSTARAAAAFRSGTLTSGAAEAARGVLGALSTSFPETMIMRKSLWIVLACCVGLAGAGLVARQALSARPDEPGGAGLAATQTLGQRRAGGQAGVRLDRQGDPLPEGALARLGTTRFRYEGYVFEDSLCFMPDGKAMVAVNGEALWMWQFPGGKLLKRLTSPEIVRMRSWQPQPQNHHWGRVTTSSDGKLIAIGTDSGEIELWDPIANKRVRQMKGDQSESVCALAFLPGDKILASGALVWKQVANIFGGGRPEAHVEIINQSVRLWDVLTGKELLKLESGLEGHKSGEMVSGIAFAPNRRIAAMGTLNGVVRLWDLESRKPVRDLKVVKAKYLREDHNLMKMAFSADGQKLATGLKENDGWVTLWEVSTGKKLRRLKVAEDTDYCCGYKHILGLQLSPDGKTLAAGISARTIQLWDAQTGKRLRTLTCPILSAVHPLAFSSDSETLVAGGFTHHPINALQMWDVSTGKRLPTSEGQERAVRAVAFSSDGKSLASCGINTVLQWDIDTSKLRHRLEETNYNEFYYIDIDILAYSPDNKMLAGAGTVEDPKGMWDSNSVWLWNAVTGKRLHMLKCELAKDKGARHKVTSLTFSPDGKTLAAGWSGKHSDYSDMVELWQVDPGRGLRRLRSWPVVKQKQSRGVTVTFSPDGRRLTSMCGSETTIWDSVTGKQLRKISRIPSGSRSFDLSSATFSLDGKMLASHDNGGIKRAVEVVLGGGKVEDVGGDKTVRLEEVASGQERLRIPVKSSHVTSLALSPDGRLMASKASDERVVRLWDATTGKQLHQFPTGPSWYIAESDISNAKVLAFSSDSKTLATGNPDTTVLIWDVTPWARKKTSAANVPSAELKASWTALAGSNGTAHEAMWKLVAASDQAVPLLAERLRPAPAVDAGRVRSLLTDLDSSDFQVRDRTRKELEKMGRGAEPFLRQALKDNKLSLEARRNMKEVLEKLNVNGVSLWQLPLLRSVEVLERIGTPAARQALQKVAATPPGDEVGEEARAALQRLSRRLP